MRQTINVRRNIIQLQCISSTNGTASEWRGIDHLRCAFRYGSVKPHRYLLNGQEISSDAASLWFHESAWYKDRL